MAKKETKDDLKLEAFPEEITEDGLRIYGETSYENQMAVLSTLFAGIGGFRIAFQNLGGKCVYSSEMFIHSHYSHNSHFSHHAHR